MDCKTCTKCGESKPLDDFPASKKYAGGRFIYCRSCNNARAKAYREQNPAKVLESVKRWAAANLPRVNATRRALAKAKPDKFKEQRKARYAREREISSARSRAKVDSLAPAYVASAIGISTADLTPELLTLKREQLELHRLAKQVKQHLKDEA